MRLSNLFFTTLRDDPAEAEMPSHRLLLRAGYVRQLGSGIYSLLPLGFRVNKRVEQVIREEMDRIGCQEMEMPVVHPADIWRESGRYDEDRPGAGPVQGSRRPRHGPGDDPRGGRRDPARATSCSSYRQLPMMVYHFQTKFRDEPRSRGGLIRVREFVMKDAYSCDRDEAGLDASYQAQYEAYDRIFERLGLDAIVVGADVGIMGGSRGPRVHGPQRVRRGHARPLRVVRLRREPADRRSSASPTLGRRTPLPMEEVETPGATTIATLADLPRTIGPERTAKAAFFMTGDGRFVDAIVRGDYDVNETKLVNAIKATGGLRPATVEEIKAPGMEPGYGSPIGARDATVVVDELVGAIAEPRRRREPGRLALRTSTSARDFTPDVVADITNAREGDPCPTCGEPVKLRNGIEVGNIFKLGTDFTDADRRDVPRRGRRGATRSSWARTGSGSAGTSPASSRPTTTTRGSSGPRRSRRTRPTS